MIPPKALSFTKNWGCMMSEPKSADPALWSIPFETELAGQQLHPSCALQPSRRELAFISFFMMLQPRVNAHIRMEGFFPPSVSLAPLSNLSG